MDIRVKVYDLCKYDPKSQKIDEVQHENVSFKVESLTDFELMDRFGYASFMSRDGMFVPDEYKEYLVVTLANGSQVAYRNSHVDVFRQ